ncbi:MAG: metallophosphoesterase family protein [Planctomycetota bacterium]
MQKGWQDALERVMLALRACPPSRLLPPELQALTTLGLLSDSHGRASTTQRAVELLLDAGADTLIHLGDVGTVQVIDAMIADHPATGRPIDVHLVFGNTDWDARALADYATDMGMAVHDPSGELEVDGCTLAFTHGHLEKLVGQLLAREPDYLLHGHTHRVQDQQMGSSRVINPGALFRASKYTVATLTPMTGAFEVLELNGVAW